MISRFSKICKITTKDIQKIAEVVKDTNPVHTDPEFAAKTRFKSPIAHGVTALVILNSLIPHNYSVQNFKIRFTKPIYP